MPIQEQHYQITGMKQDNLVGTGFSTKFAHEIKNMRLNTIGDYTTGAWTTEKGTKEMTVYTYTSEKYQDREPANNPIANYFPIINNIVDLKTLKVLGQAVINEQWILFGTIKCTISGKEKSIDCILRLFISKNTLYCEVLYFGNLNFDFNHPLETLTYFENEDIQKVYFTDGVNQPRMINVVNVKHRFGDSLDTLETQFDFVREVALNEKVTIKKLQSGSGLFPPCTVKYAITYYDKYGSETNVVYDSPLYYPTKGERGCSPEELSGDSFEITVSNLDTNFDYIRLYSIIRTSDDATPIVRIVADKAVPPASLTRRSVTFVDTNTTGEIIDPNVLRYVGGRNVTAQTFDQKSNALFLGNIELKTKSVTAILNDSQFNPSINWQISSDFTDNWYKRLKLDINESYPYTNQLNPKENSNNDYSSFGIKHFKKGESYRFGLQFQDKYGIWSEVVHTSNMDSVNTIGLKILYDDINHIATIDFTTPAIELSSSISETLYVNGYRKVRLVCAKKNNTNRTILAQGVIDSTVWEMRTRGDNGPYAMTSWFFRPREGMYNNDWYDNITPLSEITFGYNSYNAFCTRRTSGPNSYTNYYTEIENIVGSLGNSHKLPLWYVDRETLTFHSPELEFDDYIKTLDSTGYKLRVVGYIPIEHISSSYYISSDFAPISGTKAFTSRYYQPFHISTPNRDLKSHGVNSTIVYNRNSNNYGATLYPFKNNDIASQAGYNYKIYGSLLTSNIPVFSDTTYKIEDNDDIQRNIELDRYLFWKNDNLNEIKLNYFKIFEKNDSRYIRIPISKEVDAFNDNDDTWYNKLLPYLVYSSGMNAVAPTSKNGEYPSDSNLEDYCTKPIGLTYNTNTHGILVRDIFNEDDTEQYWYDYETSTLTPFGRELRPYLWLVNLEKETNADTNDITTEVFVPCGPIIKLQTDANTLVYGLEGDHYFMRYDCLKTFPRSLDDTNQIVEVLSFMTETRINLDGRYDNNRGLTENTTVTGDNFNLINKSYTQDNDFYQYTTLDDLSAKLDKFSNQITYTSVKIANEDVDAWTNITLANVDDADGGCGQITKILNINDKLFLFQDHGIARINYDEKTALSTDSGIPIELNSSGKYTGIDYINKNIGCQNKWSISNTKNGLMWIDDSRRELLALDESLTSITTLNGFDAFMIQNCNTETPWNPNDFNNFITFYDKLSKDIYFINRDTCLAWNEIPKTFTSFYDYNQVSALATINKSTLMFRNTNNNGSIYAAREANEYSYFFNETKPYWITLVCDGSSNQNNNFSLDKIFDTIEYRADIYNLDGSNTNYAKSIFNKKHVWNGYQDSEECDLDGIRKFNTWRVQLPRHKGTRDRIRNPFCYIKLKEDRQGRQAQTERVILHDLAVSYTIK